MATTNPVFQVLATSGNVALLAAGSTPGSLAVGQLGIFNYHTGLSVDGSVPADTKDIFLAVGANITGAGAGATLEDVNKSAGQMIQTRLLRALSLKAYLPAVAKVVEVNFSNNIKCNTDYAIKIEFRSQKSYGINGYNQFTKTFNYRTVNCANDINCANCPIGDPIELVLGLLADIAADTDAMVTATLFVNTMSATFATNAGASASVTVTVGNETFLVPIASGDTPTVYAAKIAAFINATTTSAFKATSAAAILTVKPIFPKSGNSATLIALTNANGTSITAGTYTSTNLTVASDSASIAAFKLAFPGVYPAIRLTAARDTAVTFNGGIPLKYYSSRDVDMIVSLPAGFDSSALATTATNLQYEDGNGAELALKEYEAGGFNGKPGPYRTSAITGLQRGIYSSQISPTSNYTQVVMMYDQFSVGGWLEYINNLQTIIAVPCADATTLVSLFTMFDLIFTQFGAMTNDAASITCNGAGNVRTGLLTAATDGIEIVA